MTQPEIWHNLKYDTTWFMTQPEIWCNLNYDTTWNTIQSDLWHSLRNDKPELWHNLRYDITWIMTQPEILHNLRHDTAYLLFRCITNILFSTPMTVQCAASCTTSSWICYLLFNVRLLLQLLTDVQSFNIVCTSDGANSCMYRHASK